MYQIQSFVRQKGNPENPGYWLLTSTFPTKVNYAAFSSHFLNCSCASVALKEASSLPLTWLPCSMSKSCEGAVAPLWASPEGPISRTLRLSLEATQRKLVSATCHHNLVLLVITHTNGHRWRYDYSLASKSAALLSYCAHHSIYQCGCSSPASLTNTDPECLDFMFMSLFVQTQHTSKESHHFFLSL